MCHQQCVRERESAAVRQHKNQTADQTKELSQAGGEGASDTELQRVSESRSDTWGVGGGTQVCQFFSQNQLIHSLQLTLCPRLPAGPAE